MNHFSDSQAKALAILPHITGTLSLLGSSSILYDILKDRNVKMKRPYCRIMLELSLFDILASSSYALSTIPMPAGTIYGARGTTQTCTAAGFFIHLSVGSLLFNLMLTIYYTLSGRYKMTDEDFAKKYERYMHATGVVFTLSVALGKNICCCRHEKIIISAFCNR